MYIIDFDDTLFNNTAFKEARKKALEVHGVSPELYHATYESIGPRAGYTNHSHAHELAKHGFDHDQILQALNTTTESEVLKNCLLPDADYFLDTLRATGKPLVLLTYCNPEFQQHKVGGAGVVHYFDDLILTSDSKITELRTLFAKHPLLSPWFINDKIEETHLAHQAFPQLRPVLKMVPGVDESLYAASGLPAFKTLKEISEYVTEHHN